MEIKKTILFFLFVILSLGNIVLGIRLNYPPYEEELKMLTCIGKIQPLVGKITIWHVRLVSAFLLITTLIIFYKLLKKVGFSENTSILSILVIIISPYALSLWMFRPKICLTIFLIITWLNLWFTKKNQKFLIFLLIASTFLLFYSSLQGLFISLGVFSPLIFFRLLKEKRFKVLVFFLAALILFSNLLFKNPNFKQSFKQIPLYNLINPSNLEEEINERIRNEDSLSERVVFPLWFRRIGYNKIFWAYKNITQEILGFFDLETLFFQEVHPLKQKSEIIFYWAEIFFFALGIIWLVKKKFAEEQKTILFLTALSLIFYLLTINDSWAAKHTLTLFTLAILVGMGINQLPKELTVLPIFLLILSIWINSYDILKRPLYWYDNRPYIYSEAVNFLKTLSLKETPKIKEIYISTLVGNPELYYSYYFSSNPQVFIQNSSLHFTSFDLKGNTPNKDALYAGFLGEFIGPDPFNNFSEKDLDKIKDEGLQILKIWKTYDTIAYGYSDYFIVAYAP
jgi:hypothetical protein